MSKGKILKASCRLDSLSACLGSEQYSLPSAVHQRGIRSLNTEQKTKEGETAYFFLG